ncbi:MAG TPA: zinc ribbon domain-containing protein [Candidatus Acidoferrales bacterium]|nr:zinc ribbon domain-containing protein [Candidatus Acidoferrales bacterium]
MANQVQNQPTAAYWLSLIGGILAVLGSLAFFVYGAIALSAESLLSGYGYYGDYTGYSSSAFGLAGGILIAIGVWMLICSILVIVFARKLKANPMAHGKYGKLILVFSLIGSWSILNFIGGILAITYKPIPAGAAPQQYYAPPPQQQYQAPPQTRVCPQCGTQMQANVRYCPNCGRQQY